MQPSDRGWRSSIRPFAIVVVANGSRCRSITSRSRPISRRRIADAPITATGRRAGWRHRHVLRQVEVDGPGRLAQRQRDRLGDGGCDGAGAQRQRRLGDRTEERVVVDRHLDTPAELRRRQGERRSAAPRRRRRSPPIPHGR
jgi:hypothetical protein